MDRIETQRLLFRKARSEDLLPAWNNIWKDEILAKTMLWRPALTLKEAEERMEKTIAIQSANFAWFVCLKETDEPIGFCGVRETSPGQFEDAGLCIARSMQGQGLGREMLTALVDFVFAVLGGERFEYGCFRENAVSAALCKGCGFTYFKCEECTRKWDGHRYLCDFYQLNRKDWAPGKTL